MATKKSKSSLVSHHIPPFYACYLLKSIRTPRSCATYIGSTPSPPRRIRQHNGEISQGAWKTKSNRPWIMQMIVYGFPSKLAALQFEWAWQHPYISRHLRDANGKALFTKGRSRYIKANIGVVRTMISCHPYNTWPLHVKFFTEEALRLWNGLSQGASVQPLPRGFTYQVELEGVDGKSGKPGSGRTGPIDVSDETFTSGHVTKHKALIASGKPLICFICNKPMQTYATEHLSTALCPARDCTAVSHLLCLSQFFLKSQPDEEAMIPRGGHCGVCETYVLWGDVVKGSYRRQSGKPTSTEQDQESDEGELFMSDMDDQEDVQSAPESSSPVKRNTTKGIRTQTTSAINARPTLRGPSNKTWLTQPGARKGKNKAPQVNSVADVHHPADSEQEEYFDLNAISPDDEEDDAPPIPQRYSKANAPLSRGAHSGAGPPGSHAGPSRLNPPPKRKRDAPALILQRGSYDSNSTSDDTDDDGVPLPPPHLQKAPATCGDPTKSTGRSGTSSNNATRTDRTHAQPRQKPVKVKLRPQFDLFHFPEDHGGARGDLLRNTAWNARASSPSIEFPEFISFKKPTPQPRSERRRGRLVIQEGEEDFFASEGQTIAPSGDSLSGTRGARGDLPQKKTQRARDSSLDLTSAMSTISVSSPSPVLGNEAAEEEDVDIISLSD